MITRHFIDVGTRRVHYRKSGKGPPLLLVHQSPRSSAEYTALMQRWSAHFTCIAPDTPGFGQSDPLPERADGARLEIGDFAEAILQFMQAVGLQRTAAYGFHSGGMILASALRQQPAQFSALAIGGYGVWTAAEMDLFGEQYLPPFKPSAYGEHLTWAWNRVMEQSWFFPWFAVSPDTRLRLAHADPARVDAVIRDLLDSGDAYRTGYGAVLRAGYELPSASASVPPGLITAYDGDPLQGHLSRLQPLPAGWKAYAVKTPADHEAASLEFLLRNGQAPSPRLGEAADQGFLPVATDGFDGLIHWRGRRGAPVATLHAPGGALEQLDGADLALDLPGHGLSDDWKEERPTSWDRWQQVIDAAAAGLGFRQTVHAASPAGDPARVFPDLSPDRFGAYLTTGWSIVRARNFFSPWYEASAANSIPFEPEGLDPERLARDHRALVRARSARALLQALNSRSG